MSTTERQTNANTTLVAAFYAFYPLNDSQREALLGDLPTLAADGGVVGSVLIAKEGVNGTISGPKTSVEEVLARIQEALNSANSPVEPLEVKRSWADKPVFRRFKARHK